MQERKILYFDYWTIGINNFKFDNYLKERGYTTKLVHLGSWRGIEGPAHEEIHGIQCYDIKYYSTVFLHEVLKIEKPLAVVMLNSTFITDRTVILSCRKLNIKTVYLMHGSLTREEFIDESIKSMNQGFKGNKIKRAIKHMKGTVLNYLNSIFRYDKKYVFRLHPYKVLLKTFTDPGTYLHFPPPSFDLMPDLTLVYGPGDVDFYSERFLHDKSKIKVVGNPDLDKYFQQMGNLGDGRAAFYKENNLFPDKPYVTYIEEGLVEDRVWKDEDRLEFIGEVSRVCQETGFRLVIKLHPRTAKGPNRHSFDTLKDVTILSQVDFPKLIYFTEKCICHYSTTLIYAILLNKPILVPRWGNSANLLNVYTDREVTFVHSLDEFKQRMKDSIFHYDRGEYIKNHVPFRDGKTSERISNYILELVK